MAGQRKRIAVVGGGFAGLASVAVLKNEGNLDSVCFEKTDKPGGTWCYREESVVGVASIMPTTVINHSKEMGAISMLPPDKKSPNYMRHKEMYEYIMGFVRKHKALEHVRYNSEVIEVRRTPDYDETGQWNVTVRDTLTGNVETNTFDGVVVCVGHINIPKCPSYKGQEKFKGQVMHTHSLKGVSPYQDKNVVVVGMGCSGLDAAVDLSNVANQVYLSTTSGAHVITRMGPYGWPVDYVLLRRYFAWIITYFPNLASWIIEKCIVDTKFNSKLYAVEPKLPIMSKDPVVNDHFGSKLLSGSIIQKGAIIEITEDGVLFDGDSEETKVDVIVFATGYTWEFPFLEEGVLQNEGDGYKLYKCIWPPHLKHPTLAFVGLFLPWGPGVPVGEVQIRYVTHVMSGNTKLPSAEEMERDVEQRVKSNNARYRPNSKQTIRVDYVQYQDEITELIGAKPNFLKLFFTDPQLFFKLVFGPSLPYQYRLQGPHAWSGAREAIMTADERVLYPLKRVKTTKVESSFIYILRKIVHCLLPFT